MKKIKSVAAVLVLAVTLLTAVTCFSGCADGRNDKVVIRLKVPESLTMNCVSHPEIRNANDFLTRAKDAFEKSVGGRVTVKIDVFISGHETEAITNTFGTDDAADILYDDFFNMSSYIHTGNAVPLDGVFSPEISADLEEGYLNFGRVEGRQYMMPYSSRQNVLIYNKELLRACGLDEYFGSSGEIQNWDISDWNTILDTLAEKLPSNSFPMMMYAGSNQGDTHIMTLLRSQGSAIYDADGNFDLETDEAIAAFKWIQDGVDKGWYMPESDAKSMKDCSNKFSAGQLAFYHFNLGSSLYPKINTQSGDGLEKYGLVNYPGGIATLFCNGFEVFDNGDSKKINAAKEFVRFIYDHEEWLEYSAGEIPISKSVAQKYKSEIFLYDAWKANYEHVADFSLNLPNWQGRDDSVRSVFYKEIAELLKKRESGGFAATPEACAQNLNAKLNAAITYGREHSRLHK